MIACKWRLNKICEPLWASQSTFFHVQMEYTVLLEYLYVRNSMKGRKNLAIARATIILVIVALHWQIDFCSNETAERSNW